MRCRTCLPFSNWPRSMRLFGESGRKSPPKRRMVPGTAANPRDSLHPQGVILYVPMLISCAIKMPAETTPSVDQHRDSTNLQAALPCLCLPFKALPMTVNICTVNIRGTCSRQMLAPRCGLDLLANSLHGGAFSLHGGANLLDGGATSLRGGAGSIQHCTAWFPLLLLAVNAATH